MIKNEKSKSNFFNIGQNFPSQNYMSTNDTNKTGYKKGSFNKLSNKELNIKNFMKQKNKFYISNIFDEKEAKVFLESKDVALEEIKLNDEIEKNENIKDKPDINSPIKNHEFISEKNLKKKITKKGSISPRKRKSKDKTGKNKFSNKRSNKEVMNSNIFNTVNDRENDSNDNNFIYKFIIDNVDESEDNFHQKLKKEIRRVESKKYNLTKKSNDDDIGRTFTSNKKVDKRSVKVNISNKSEAKLNPFNYSETTKNLMVGNDIEVSSINDDILITPDKKTTKMLATLDDKKASTNKNLLNEVQINANNNSFEINSSHESLMSILSGLI